ncbi:hypothetical protein OG738_38490 [Amycolatopsis sp. NBC_01488]|uniref:hypothetical protein n=1 Tax=Amycolatopsis sp. NBC_01488 TaxID=2903563 RepID=UPI002E2A901A|nr:hypothetical protein [Amycolatopsis sp. NBC_01488]
MRVHQTVVIGAAAVLNIVAMGILGTSAASVAGGQSVAPVPVSPGEMGYNTASPGEMGYNGVSPDEMGYN